MKKFLQPDFLLETRTAERLYHEYAEGMPIFDFHCHVPPSQIAENTRFDNLTRIWLGGDHYKWRAMRANGIPEERITGSASDYEKFLAWAETVPYTIGNPLYHWTHLELSRCFGIDNILLSPKTAPEIWERANKLLAKDEYRVKGLIRAMNVRVICTTDDPVDDLAYHAEIAKDTSFKTVVVPAFRPDKAMAVEKRGEYRPYIEKLAAASRVNIHSYDDLLEALDKRHAFFHEHGSRLSDHGICLPVYEKASEQELDRIFRKAMDGGEISPLEDAQFKTALILFFGRLDAKRGWTFQLHMGAIRNNNSRMFKIVGPDSGFDAITDGEIAVPLSHLLDELDSSGELPKTILYVLNPRDNELIASMIGCFQDGNTPGKMQFGSAWWFNDQKDGMERQLTALASLGLLSRFVGMLTDSRSFLSYPRHEYFRRILCNLVGGWAERGEAPHDMELLGGMIRDISYGNAVRYFGIPGVEGV